MGDVNTELATWRHMTDSHHIHALLHGLFHISFIPKGKKVLVTSIKVSPSRCVQCSTVSSCSENTASKAPTLQGTYKPVRIVAMTTRMWPTYPLILRLGTCFPVTFFTVDNMIRYWFERIHILTYILTTWSRVLLEKLTGFGANQEILRILRNPKVRYCTHNRPPPVPIHIPDAWCLL